MSSHGLQQILGNAREAQLAAGDHYLVGICGTGIPDEPIIAAGARPSAMLLRCEEPAPLAEQYLDAGEEPAMRSLFQQICDPAAPAPGLVLLGPPYAQLASIIEEIRRSGDVAHASPTFYYELLAIQSQANRSFAIERTAALAARVGSLTGIAPTAERLAMAIGQTNARRIVMQRFIALRRQAPVLSGVDAFRVLMAARTLPCADYTDLLAGLVQSLRPDNSLAGRPRVLLLASTALDHFRAHEAMEQGGALIVAEDDPCGSRAAVEPIPQTGDPLAAIAEHTHRHCTGQHVYPRESRLGWFHEQAGKPDIDAVIIYAEHPHFGWDFPGICEFLRAHGKRWLVVHADARTRQGFDAVVEQVAAFVAALPGSRR